MILRYINHPLLTSSAALLVYGSWAALVNVEHGYLVALKAGLAQGTYAFVSTLLISVLALRIFHALRGGWWAGSLAFFSSSILALIIPITVHSLLATPDMWEAMALGLVWGSGYLVWLLWLEQRRVFARSA